MRNDALKSMTVCLNHESQASRGVSTIGQPFRQTAIKTMLPEGLSPQEFEEYKNRFKVEAMAAGVLAHPNIITVYDFGEDNGVLYLAMEFLDGKPLEKIVQEQVVLPIETILPIYDQVCDALDHAHRRVGRAEVDADRLCHRYYSLLNGHRATPGRPLMVGVALRRLGKKISVRW